MSEIPLNYIRPSPMNPRTLLNPIPEEDITEMAAEILRDGLVEPISVRPLEEQEITGEVRFEIIDGERRWRACVNHHIANEIKAVIKPISKQRADYERLIVNRDRKQYSWTQEWIGIKKLAEEYDKTNRQVAREQNVSEGTVSKAFSILDSLSQNLLPKVVKGRPGVKATETGNITIEMAYDLVTSTQEIENVEERNRIQGLYANQILDLKLDNEGGRRFIRRIGLEEIEQVRGRREEPIKWQMDNCLRRVIDRIVECSSNDCKNCVYYRDCRRMVKKAVKVGVLESVPEHFTS